MSKALLGNQHAKGYKQSEEHIRKRVEAQKKTKALKRKLKEEKFAHCVTSIPYC